MHSVEEDHENYYTSKDDAQPIGCSVVIGDAFVVYVAILCLTNTVFNAVFRDHIIVKLDVTECLVRLIFVSGRVEENSIRRLARAFESM